MAERQKVNKTWMAHTLGASKQSVAQWLSGEHEPSNPDMWVRMASALGLLSPINTEFSEQARELALEVLVRSTDEGLRAKAASLLKLFLEKSA
jgi:DNA-binding XRE family transcriptional regulator